MINDAVMGIYKMIVRALAYVAFIFVYADPEAAKSVNDKRVVWQDLPHIAMQGGLKVFWNVTTHDPDNSYQAYAHGFSPITLIDPYSNRGGGGKQEIYPTIRRNNPWTKPSFFEAVVRQDIRRAKIEETVVQDIEFEFESDPAKAWADPGARISSGVATFESFGDAYYREWATWFTQPLRWTKDFFPRALIGLYGRQPFDRDYWGIANKMTADIDAEHTTDWRLWKEIEMFVDFYVVSIYNFYDRPDAVYYMATNVEYNLNRVKQLSGKPIYVYEWMRYHPSNAWLGNREIEPYLVEAMAMVPFFSGARGIVLWGSEPRLTPGDGLPYAQLPLFMASLARIASLSTQIARGRLEIAVPAHDLWRNRQALVRRIAVQDDECVFLAFNPWQAEDVISYANGNCGGKEIFMEVTGRHVSLVHVNKGRVTVH
jgi:hypothetical protein